MLTVSDIFSKYSWTIPVKKKTGEDVTAAMKSVLRESGRVPKNLHTDRGKEFYNKNLQTLMKKYGINLYSTFSNLKASICIEKLHRKTGMKPKDVTKSNESSVRHKFAGETRKKKPKLQVGDKVRVSRAKQVFEKGHTPNWSNQIFSIKK